jgi:hypothetical protein
MAIAIATNPPHVLCFTEHHLKTYQLDFFFFQNYKHGAQCCRNIHKNGGGLCVYIYIQESCQFAIINVQNFVKKKIWKFVELNYNCQIVLLAY